jgi:hypothetical protein
MVKNNKTQRKSEDFIGFSIQKTQSEDRSCLKTNKKREFGITEITKREFRVPNES